MVGAAALPALSASTAPDPILAAISRCALHRAAYIEAVGVSSVLLSEDLRFEALDARTQELGDIY